MIVLTKDDKRVKKMKSFFGDHIYMLQKQNENKVWTTRKTERSKEADDKIAEKLIKEAE